MACWASKPVKHKAFPYQVHVIWRVFEIEWDSRNRLKSTKHTESH